VVLARNDDDDDGFYIIFKPMQQYLKKTEGNQMASMSTTQDVKDKLTVKY